MFASTVVLKKTAYPIENNPMQINCASEDAPLIDSCTMEGSRGDVLMLFIYLSLVKYDDGIN
jgi:hypothetical protein